MKKKTKILIAFALSVIFIASFSVFSFASESDGADGERESVFSLVYGFALENADKIFSLLAFIGAIILSFAYKKGLFPFVRKALSSLGAAVSSLREESEKNASLGNAFMEDLKNKLGASEAALENAEKRLSLLEEKISMANALSEKSDQLRAVMLAEVEMIYEIFISSSLPQYQKDRVGEAYLKMKSALLSEED